MTETAQANPVSLSSRWDTLSARCSEVLHRAEASARVTIPAVFVRSGHSESTKLPKPYQSLGARAVNSLSSKLVLTLFPPNSSFFRLGINEQAKEALKGAGLAAPQIAEIESKLATAERRASKRMEATTLRPVAAQAMKALLITGNFVIGIGPKLGFRGFGLRSFRVDRDPEGNVLELVIQEEVSPKTLTPAVKAACGVNDADTAKQDERSLKLYTAMVREGERWHVRQELMDKLVPGSEGNYPLDAPPFIVLRWTSVHGEDYGRGLVEEYLGDLEAVDDLSRDLLKASGNAAKVIFLIRAASLLTPKKLAAAKSGDVLQGDKDDVSVIGLDKFADFRVALERINAISVDLSAAFLMNSSVQRNAERVTAEEIRFMAQELEDALGGVYSTFSAELQRPLANRVFKVMEKENELPAFPTGDIDLTITTGLEALGRGHDLSRIATYARTVREILGEQAVTTYINPVWVLGQIAQSLGIDPKEANRSEDDINKAQQGEQARALMEKIGPGVASQAMKGAMPQ